MSLYVTVSEFKTAPTGIDPTTIVPNGTQEENDAEIYNLLTRASSWVDRIVKQDTLEATLNTEKKEVTLDNRGLIRVHPSMMPTIDLKSVRYRISPLSPWTDVDLSFVEIMERYFTIYNLNTTLVSPSISEQLPTFGYYSPRRIRSLQRTNIVVEYTYVNGYTNTYLNGATLAGANTLNIINPNGLHVGQKLTIYDGANSEEIFVQSFVGNTITTVTPLLYDHGDRVPVSALPASVKAATILLASYLVKERGSLAITMQENSLQGINRYLDAADVKTAKDLLTPFIRGVIN